MITCQCSGELNLDIEETRSLGLHISIYSCKCGKMYSLNCIGEKPRGWQTKQKLERKKFIDNIPF